MKKKNKVKVIYKEDKGETIYSMAGLYGRTPEEQEELVKKNKDKVKPTRKERRAMIRAAFQVYGPILLIAVMAFSIVAVILFLLMA